MKKKYDIKIEKQQWADLLDKAFEKKKKDIKMDGFRKGKVPKEAYIKKYGIESLFMDATDLAIPVGYDKLLEKEKVEVASQPSVDIKNIDENSVELVFEIVEKPVVKLGNYKDLKIKKEKIEVTKEQINHEIEHLKEKFVEHKTKENGEVENSNIAVIDFEGFVDNKLFEGGKGEDYSLEIGSKTFIPGFEEQIIGMKKNEQRDVLVKFPDEYPTEYLKGKDSVFKVTVKEIKEKIMPELNKDFYEDLAMEGVNDQDSLEASIEESLKANKEREVENKHTDACLEAVTKNAKFDLPEEMVEEEIDRMIKEFEQQISMQGFTVDAYLEMVHMSKDDLKNQMKDEATKRVSYRLVLEQITKDEKIEISSEDVEKEAEELAKKYNMKKDEFLNAFGGIEFVKYDMEVRKALELITK